MVTICFLKMEVKDTSVKELKKTSTDDPDQVLSNLFFKTYHSYHNGLFYGLLPNFTLKGHSKLENHVRSTPAFLWNCYHMCRIFYHHVVGSKRNDGYEQKVERTVFYINMYKL